MRNLICLMLIFGMLASCSGNRTEDDQNKSGKQDADLNIDGKVEQGDLLSDTGNKNQPFQTENPPSEVDMEEYNRLHGTPEFHFKRGLVLYSINNHEEGIREFDTVISIAPKMGSAYINRGKGRVKLNDFQNAIKDFEKAIELDKSDSTAILHLGLAHYQLNNMQGAIEANTELIRLAPKSSAGFFNRGTAYGQLKDYPRAISDFSKAIQLDPNYTDAHFNLGLAYYWTGDKTKACQSWAKAKTLGSEKAARVIETYCQ